LTIKWAVLGSIDPLSVSSVVCRSPLVDFRFQIIQVKITFLFFLIICVGKELQGKDKVHYLELKAGHVSGLKSPFMKIHTQSVYVVRETNEKECEEKPYCSSNSNLKLLEGLVYL
jgi:hypothetical protein